MTKFILTALATPALIYAGTAASETIPRRSSPSRAQLCASLLRSTAGEALASKDLGAAVDAATERLRDVERNSAYAVGPDLLGQIKAIARVFTAPFLGDRPVVVADVARPDEGLTRAKAVDQLALAAQVGEALDLLANREHMYARLTSGREAIRRKLTGILEATRSKEILHQLMTKAEKPDRGPYFSYEAEPIERPDLPLWGRVLGLGAAIGVGAGAGYVAGAQMPPPFLNALTGIATFASVLTGWIVLRDAVLDSGYRTLLKVKIWNEKRRERGERRERERREDLFERADRQIETLEILERMVGDVERKNTFAYYGFNTELPVTEIESEAHLAAESIENALSAPATTNAGPRVHVRVEFVLYFDGEQPKLLTFVNTTDNPYLGLPRYPDMFGLGMAM